MQAIQVIVNRMRSVIPHPTRLIPHPSSLIPLFLLPLAAFASSIDAHVSGTLTLKKGWNAVYFETTPDAPACVDFFRSTPQVVSIGRYRSDADAATAQYDESGKEILQQPVVFLQWVRGEEKLSSLNSIHGGYTYFVYTTDEATIDFYGEPTVPKVTWRKVGASETNEYVNLVGASTAKAQLSVTDYFGEGPHGTAKKAVVYDIFGTDQNGPELKALMPVLGRALQIESGRAYAFTAGYADNWPGVIDVFDRSELEFGARANYASVKFRNRGNKRHRFQLKVVKEEYTEVKPQPPLKRLLPRVDAVSEPDWADVDSSAWTVTLEPGAYSEQVFSLDRSKLEDGVTYYASILEVSDLDGSQMRVRIPITARGPDAGDILYPNGLWVGELALSQVSQYGDAEASPTPVTSGGLMKMNVMIHVDENRKCTLLQRVAAGVDAKGAERLFKELANVPTEIENPKRFSTVMMSVDTPAVAAASDSTFGDDAAFTWTVDAKARDNPFRHAWHPDHDGKKADYSGDLPSGDDFSLYANPVKPELWSISNRLDFSWHEQGNRSLPVHFPYNASETTSGIVTWDVYGLIANKPIRSVGTFTLKRVFKAKKIEE